MERTVNKMLTHRYWLLKSEPTVWSWEQQLQVKSEPWTGVRNYQARNFMKEMQKGDLAFFYHSNQGREIVGIVKVISSYHADPTDQSAQFGCIDVSAISSLKVPVKLEQIKNSPSLQNIPLIRQPRLSVMPITSNEWEEILKLSKGVK